MPDEPEALGLLALMLLHDARRAGRVDAAGDLVPLEEQDRTPLGRAKPSPRGSACSRRPCGAAGPARTSCRRRSPPATPPPPRRPTPTGPRSPPSTGELARLVPSPVVGLNRAVAVAMAEGPAAGLALVEALEASGDAGRLPPAARHPRRPAPPPRPPRGGRRRLPRGARAGRHRRRTPLPGPASGRDLGSGLSFPPKGGHRPTPIAPAANARSCRSTDDRRRLRTRLSRPRKNPRPGCPSAVGPFVV